MIDKNQLKQLGWSDDLINEVTRISDQLHGVVDEKNAIQEPNVRFCSESGSSIRFNTSELNTSIHIRLSDLRNK